MRPYKTAFTLLEIVFVIVVIGIVAITVIPRLNNETVSLYHAAKQLAADIRYTQHLAMIDDKLDTTDSEWYKGRWQLLFGKSSNNSGIDSGDYYAYTIFSDSPTYAGNPGPSEIAVNPLNRSKLLSGGFSNTLDWEDSRATKYMNIGYKYGIQDVRTSGCGTTNSRRIAFDHLGRPIAGNNKNWASPYGKILTQKCTFTLCQNDCDASDECEKVSIEILPETGYVHIVKNDACI